MRAPGDAKATFTAGDETYTLEMNFRTIGLAEDVRSDCVMAYGAGKPNLSGLATLAWAFAQPAHPELSPDDALALVMQHGEVVGGAINECFRLATKGVEAPASGTAARPRPLRPTR